MSGRLFLAAQVHDLRAGDVTAKVGYADGGQSHLALGPVTVYTQTKRMSLDESFALLDAIDRAVAATRAHLLSEQPPSAAVSA